MARQPTNIELDSVYEFFAPHSGRPFDGAAIGLPVAVKQAIDGLDGNRLPLRQALAAIQAVTAGLVEADAEHQLVYLWLGDRSWPPKAALHGFVVIRYR